MCVWGLLETRPPAHMWDLSTGVSRRCSRPTPLAGGLPTVPPAPEVNGSRDHGNFDPLRVLALGFSTREEQQLLPLLSSHYSQIQLALQLCGPVRSLILAGSVTCFSALLLVAQSRAGRART